MSKKKPILTVKQKRFGDFYDGNGVEAAKKAGYKGNDNTLASVAKENLRKPHILKYIKDREKERNKKFIATREQRQQFWTDGTYFNVKKLVNKDGSPKNISDLDEETAKMVQGFKVTERIIKGPDDEDPEIVIERKTEFKLVDRNKSSELLGRSEADFIERIQHDLSDRLMTFAINALKARDNGKHC